MKERVKRKLEKLRSDFESVDGKPFSHFFCPVLFRDDNSPLCRAHIVNAAFPKSSKRWTLQRKDVDNFYGTKFESDFVDLRYRREGLALEALVDPTLYRRLRPKIFLDGKEIDHFIANGPIPSHYSEFIVNFGGRSVRLGLKIAPGALPHHTDDRWRFEVLGDAMLPAVVSTIKAAHLTLFEMLGYRYALGVSGRYFGAILGEFFTQSQSQKKPDVLQKALVYFAPFARMVRPAHPGVNGVLGSVEDYSVRVCWNEYGATSTPWGAIVFIRTGRLVHGVVVPIFDSDAGQGRFLRFLQGGEDMLTTSVARFKGAQWVIDPPPYKIFRWPVSALE